MNIQTDPLNKDEHENGTRQLQENKAPGPDGITPEVLKRYKNNDIVLTFVKCILIDTQKRAQLGEKGMIPTTRYSSPKNPANWVLRVLLRVDFLVTRFCLDFAFV